MSRILATSALALALAMSVAAFAAAMKPLNTVQLEAQSDIYASKLTGMYVYATEDNIGVNARYGEGRGEELGGYRQRR